MTKNFIIALLLTSIAIGVRAKDSCTPVSPAQLSGLTNYARYHGILPEMDVVGSGSVRMYTAPRKGCEFSDPESTIPAHLKSTITADVAYNGWAYVYFPVPGDEITYAGWIDAHRIAYSKNQPKPDKTEKLNPVENAATENKTFIHSRD